MNKANIYKSLKDVKDKDRVVVLGNFDGIHKGHQALLEKGREVAKSKGLVFTVFTFYPQIQSKIDSNFKYLMTQEDKIDLLKQYDVEEVISLPFDEEFSQITAYDFMENILNEIGTKAIVVGYNFNFGYKGLGGSSDLEDYFSKSDVYVIPPVKNNSNKIISSSLIRMLLSSGDIISANEMLGRPFSISGQVTHGSKNGRKFGFPTANIINDESSILPKLGVYIAKTSVEGSNMEYLSVVSVGQRPTFDTKSLITIEVHLINFSGNLYDKKLKIKFYDYIRDIQKYSTVDELKLQIISDVEKALKMK